MEIRGIDVSAWQGKIDWKTVADYGMGFAILRITEAGNVIDLCQFPLAGQLVHYGLALKDLADEVCNDELGLFGSHRQYPPLGSFAKDTTLEQKVQSSAYY